MKMKEKPRYKQPYSIKLPNGLNEIEEAYLREYLHNKGKYEAKYKRSKWSKRMR